MSTGIYETTKKDGSTYYRVSITYKNKHISLGSSNQKSVAESRYHLATLILRNNRYTLDDYNNTNQSLPFEKWVVIINFRDNGLYFKTPIYLSKHFFTYYLSQKIQFIFDVDDLFFYSNHKIFKRGNYFFVNDYGMQLNIMSRYNIKNHASYGKDYHFLDKNCYNLRYDNIQIINPYIGVEKINKQYINYYHAKIHYKGYISLGYFKSIHKAAVAYNKAVDFMLRYVTPGKNYTKNYIDAISKDELDYFYTSIKLPDYLLNHANISH